MKLERVSLSAFGPDRVCVSADLRGAAATRRLSLPDALDATIVAEAICWALHGKGPKADSSTEVELELLVGKELFRIRRRGGASRRGASGGEVMAWRRRGRKGDASEGEVAAKGDAQLAELLRTLKVAPARVMPFGLIARASEMASRLTDGKALARFLAESASASLAAELEHGLEVLLLEVESEADFVRIRRAKALAEASEGLGEQVSAGITVEELDERRDETRLRLGAARAEVERLGAGAQGAGRLIETASARQTRLEALEQARERLRVAESKRDEIGRLKRELEQAETAAKLARSEKKLTDRQSLAAGQAASLALAKVEEKRREVLDLRDASASLLRKAEGRAAGVSKLRERLVALGDLEGLLALLERTLDSLKASEAERVAQQERRASAAASLEDLHAKRDAATRSLERARAALGAAGSRRHAELGEALAAAEGNLALFRRLTEAQERRKEVTKLHATTMIHLDRARRALDAETRQLERRLADDDTWSKTPDARRTRASVTGLESDVSRLAAELAEQEAAVQELGGEVLGLRQQLGPLAYAELAELEVVARSRRKEFAETGAPAEAIERSEAELARLEVDRERLEGELAEVEARLTTALAKEESERDLAAELRTRVPQDSCTREALVEERRAIERDIAAIEGELAAARSAAAKDAEALAALEDELVEARDLHSEALATVEERNENWAAVVREAGFRDIAAYQRAKWGPEERKSKSGRLEALESELSAAREAHRALEGQINLPVLRESDRAALEHEEWERRQRERRERLQAERVHRDRDMLQGLHEQLEAEHRLAREEERRLSELCELIERAASEMSGFAETLGSLRARHQSLSQLTDLAAGRIGPPGGFASWVADGAAWESAVRAGQWCRSLSGGELHLAVERRENGWSLELREVHGPGRRGAADMAPEERWLSGLCLELGRGEAAMLLAGAEAPLSLVVDRLPALNDAVAQDRIAAWLGRLEQCGRSALFGVEHSTASELLPSLERRGRAAAGKAC